MIILELLALIIFVVAIVSMILPWIQAGEISKLQQEVRKLKAGLEALSGHASTKPATAASLVYQAPTTGAETPASPAEPLWQSNRIPESGPTYGASQSEPKPRVKSTAPSLEQQFGARLPVWIGGIALALAGFFMVKYSIDTGMLNETVRVILGGLFGLGLLYAGHAILNQHRIANGVRIAQSVTGAGIADLYACLFAAISLYHLLPSWLGFPGMAAVTGYAVIASLRYGAPIAFLGLAGGFLTPALIHSATPSAPLLFLYLYVVIAGLLMVIRKQGWWICGALAVVACFLWVLFWIAVMPLDSGTGFCLGLFLLAVSGTVVMTSRHMLDDIAGEAVRLSRPAAAVNTLTLGGAVLLMALVVDRTDFDIIAWLLFGILSAGALVLAWFKPRIYGFAPWLALALTIVTLAAWHHPDSTTLAITVVLFGALFSGSSYWFLWRSERPVAWALLSAVASMAYYLLGYYQLRAVYNCTTIGLPVWGIGGLLLAGLAVHAAFSISRKFAVSDSKTQKLLATCAAATTGFLSLALSIELPVDFLPVAFAGEILAISWINTTVNVTSLRRITGVLAGIFAALLLPQICLLLQLTLYSLFEIKMPLQRNVPIVTWPLLQLGLPALLFGGGAWLLRQKQDDKLVACLEAAAVALLGLMGYYLTRHTFHANDNLLFAKANFSERGVITNVLFTYGLICLTAGRLWKRSTLSLSGMVLCGISLFRIGYFDLLIYNPAWSHQAVGATPIFNALALPYGLPVLWLALASRELRRLNKSGHILYAKLVVLALLFALVSLNVRQLYHGEYLDGHSTSNGEVYAYSVAWLLMGIGTLMAGTLRHDRVLRRASLIIMLLTVGKVFLYDASALTGLYRIFSFLGLGLSLLALSWFYTRFVFADGREDRKP